jgi:hypothetical protein
MDAKELDVFDDLIIFGFNCEISDTVIIAKVLKSLGTLKEFV